MLFACYLSFLKPTATATYFFLALSGFEAAAGGTVNGFGSKTRPWKGLVGAATLRKGMAK